MKHTSAFEMVAVNRLKRPTLIQLMQPLFWNLWVELPPPREACVALVDELCHQPFRQERNRLFGIREYPSCIIRCGQRIPHGNRCRESCGIDSLLFGDVCLPTVIGECHPNVSGRASSAKLQRLTENERYPILEPRAQFYPDYFARIPPPPAHETRPFRMMFIGRIDRIKGVFDILDQED